jgi:hypothetical protein
MSCVRQAAILPRRYGGEDENKIQKRRPEASGTNCQGEKNDVARGPST